MDANKYAISSEGSTRKEQGWLACCCILNMTGTLKLEAPWDEVKEKLKEINTNLTDEDLAYQPGQERILLERLSRKMNRGEEDIRKWIESVSANKGKAS